MKHSYLLASFLFAISYVANSQKIFNYEKNFSKIDKLYEKGEYKKALKKNKGEKKSSDKRLQAFAWLYEAKIREAQGLMKEMEGSLKKSLEVAEEFKTTEPRTYNLFLVKLAAFYREYGNPRKSVESIERITSADLPPLQQHEKNAELGKSYILAGKFEQAEKHLLLAIRGFDSLLNSKNLKRPQKIAAKKQKARLLTQRAYLDTQRGYYNQADSILKTHQLTVRKLTSVVDIAYIEHLIAFARNREAQERYRTANQYYRKGQRANEYYDFAFKKSSKSYFLMQESIVKNHIYNEAALPLEYSFAMLKLKKDTKHFFPKNSSYFARIKLLEAERAMKRRSYQKAQKILLEILDPKSPIYLPADHELRAIATKYLAKTYEKDVFTKIEEVEKTYQDWLAIQQSRYPTDGFTYQVSNLELADFYLRETENFQVGKAIFESNPLEQIAKNISQISPSYIRIANWFANYYENIDQYDKAMSLVQKNVQFAEKNYGSSDIRFAKQLAILASVQAKNGDYKEAEKAISKATDITKLFFGDKSNVSPVYAEALVKMAAIQGSIANYAKADSLLRNAELILANYEALPKKKKSSIVEDEFDLEAMKAESIEETARQYIRIGSYELTEKLLLQVLEEREKKFGSQGRRLIRPLIELANLYIIKTEYLKADAYINRALAIAEKAYGKDNLIYAQSLEILARLQNNLGDVEGAKKSISEAIRIISKIFSPKHIQNAPFLSSLAVIDISENVKQNFASAEEKLLQSREIIEKTFDKMHPQYAEILQTMSALYLEVKGKNQQAINFLNQAEQIWIKKFPTKENINFAKIAALKAEAYLQQGNIQAAEQSLLETRSIYTKIFGEQHEGVVKTNSKLGRVYYMKKDYENANQALLKSTAEYLNYVKKFFPFLSEKQKAKYWYSIQGDFEFFKNLVLAQLSTKPELVAQLYNQLLQTKGLLLDNHLRVRNQILASNNAELIKSYRQLLNKKELYINSLEMSLAERKRINTDALEKEIASLEKQINAETAKIGLHLSNDQEITWKDIQKQLKEGEVALEITRISYYDKQFTDSVVYLALKVAPGSLQPEAIVLPHGNEMEKDMLNYFRNTIMFNKATSTEPYEFFWKPIEKSVRNAKAIYFAADGVYTQINPELLYNGTQMLIDLHNFIFVNSSKDLLSSKAGAEQINKSAFLVANPEFYLKNKEGGAVAYLPGTFQEAKGIEEILRKNAWQANLYLWEKATEEQVKNNKIDASILHFATHGFFLESLGTSEGISEELAELKILNNPMMRSGLMLAGAGDLVERQSFIGDGILTAQEISNISLDNTQIVILSACETGRGEVALGEGVFGLQRALFLAGAKNIIMSLFKVDDAATAELMSLFYEYYLNQANDIHTAFRNARITLRKKYQKPIYWGSFILLGK